MKKLMPKQRDKKLDIIKGFLIICVVLGHADSGLLHDIIFLFHMPLFFIVAGYLLDVDRLLHIGYLKNKISKLLVPYCVYLMIDLFIVRKSFSWMDVAKAIWGGRVLTGTYWYITCFSFALIIFRFCLLKCSSNICKKLILLGGGIAIIESHMSEWIHLLRYPGVPLNFDVSLLAAVYLAIGFYYKKTIRTLLEDASRKFDSLALIIGLLLVAFCFFNYLDGRCLYYFDMKPLYYKELIFAMVIPCMFGIVLCRVVYWLEYGRSIIWIDKILIYLGRMTIPIMFMHIPLNTWKSELGYGFFVYLLIGIGVPVVFTVVFSRFKVMRRLFGLSDLYSYESGGGHNVGLPKDSERY